MPLDRPQQFAVAHQHVQPSLILRQLSHLSGGTSSHSDSTCDASSVITRTPSINPHPPVCRTILVVVPDGTAALSGDYFRGK
jgi:hypothetical protein